MLALIAYKPIAASIYAVAFALMGATGCATSSWAWRSWSGHRRDARTDEALQLDRRLHRRRDVNSLGMLGTAGRRRHARRVGDARPGRLPRRRPRPTGWTRHGPGPAPHRRRPQRPGTPPARRRPSMPAPSAAAAAGAGSDRRRGGAAARRAAAGAATGGATLAAQAARRRPADSRTQPSTGRPTPPATPCRDGRRWHTDSHTRPRTYGGWRRSRGMGLMGLGPLQTLLVLGAVTLLVIAATVSFTALLVASPCRAVALLVVVLARWTASRSAHGLVRGCGGGTPPPAATPPTGPGSWSPASTPGACPACSPRPGCCPSPTRPAATSASCTTRALRT